MAKQLADMRLVELEDSVDDEVAGIAGDHREAERECNELIPDLWDKTKAVQEK